MEISSVVPHSYPWESFLRLCTKHLVVRHASGLSALLAKSFFYLPYLSSIHKKANCITIFWAGHLHTLESYHFQNIWATCLPHKGGASRQVPCPRIQQANLPACSPQPPRNAEHQAGKLWIPFFKVFSYDSTRGLNPRSTNCKVDALTTMPWCWFIIDTSLQPSRENSSKVHFSRTQYTDNHEVQTCVHCFHNGSFNLLDIANKFILNQG